MNPQEAKKIEKRILEILKKHLKPSDIVIAGISGGPDSVFLLHILKQLGTKIIVAHVNHQLRKEANDDEKFVKSLAKSLVFAPLKANIKSLSKKNKTGIEETGRKIRYDFFQKLAKKHQAKFILTAHHADDNLETIILNFTRGAGLQGMSGMLEVSVSLLRPLLSISKEQILAFLKHKKIPFRVDKSNNSIVYKRNFIRHKIIPLFKKLNPNLTDTLAKNSQNVRELNDCLKSIAKSWIKTNSLDKFNKKYDAKSFREQPIALQKIILLEIYQMHFHNTANIESKHLEESIQLIQKNIGNKKKPFGRLTIHLKNNIITLV